MLNEATESFPYLRLDKVQLQIATSLNFCKQISKCPWRGVKAGSTQAAPEKMDRLGPRTDQLGINWDTSHPGPAEDTDSD
jgi:hypothetical protein